MFTHTCQLCGDEFQSPSNRAKYCVYCRDKAQVMRNKAYKKKQAAGTSLKIGSENICCICGKKYIVTSGSKKYCDNCAKEQIRANKKQPTSAYISNNYDYISFNVPKGERESIKSYAESCGMSIKELMLTALEEYKKNHRGEKNYE